MPIKDDIIPACDLYVDLPPKPECLDDKRNIFPSIVSLPCSEEGDVHISQVLLK